METIFRIALFIAGMINFIPSLLTFFPTKIGESYGIEIPDANYELLLRHRAVLFGIIGGFMIYSTITQKHYNVSVLIGLVSMISFLILFQISGDINPQLTKVMKIDILGIVILLAGYGLYRTSM